ncbi:Uu.00g028210.m01.CDS01 [Anthostomella pinea]|uniref:Uu.00g028210.m01.CDS01 n=1 Tax=Anthostomella pinea TaxID=933095 RepID=A0AAI8YCX0_9PEZI|nr:Uu.00g028210.m01.CDS01 [Anthostomella pinea]
MADNPRSPASSSSRSRTVRSQKITMGSPTAEPSADERREALDRAQPIRSHTPGHLSTKSHGGSGSSGRRKTSESSIRQRSQSVTSKGAPLPPSNPTPVPTLTVRRNGDTHNSPLPTIPSSSSSAQDLRAGSSTGGMETDARRPTNMRSTSAIAGKPSSVSISTSAPPRKTSSAPRPRGPYTKEPPLQDPNTAPDVPAAPSSGMYWSRAPVSGASHTPLRAHTTTLVGSNVFVFGGCDSRACFNELYVLDADSFHWSSPHVAGDVPVPLRAMTCTAVGKKLVVFGGGDGPAYYNDVYVLDTINFRWHRPRIVGDRIPSARRAHTACLYKNGIYVFGGGDGVRALNDIWRLDVSDVHKMSWKLVSGPSSGSGSKDSASSSNKPKARGYHTANMVGSKLIIYGGSDGGECFNDVWVYDVDATAWKAVNMPTTFRRLSHTSTIVGSYLFVVGGHDGNEYSNEVLLLNLVTMTWDKRRVYGLPPSGRGYHGAVLYDSRLLVIGGFDGGEVFADVWMLELAVHAYYSQISHFTIEV